MVGDSEASLDKIGKLYAKNIELKDEVMVLRPLIKAELQTIFQLIKEHEEHKKLNTKLSASWKSEVDKEQRFCVGCKKIFGKIVEKK